jgi:glycosyltransferase involved in cell wall biosynthesis
MTSSVSKNQKYFDQLNLKGCQIYFMLYDLLPVTNPEWFPISEPPVFDAWLKTISRYDGLVSISEATKNMYLAWSKKNKINLSDGFKILVAPCGAEMSKSSPTIGVPSSSNLILKSLSDAPSFLMVGTLEPRKNHKKVIEAFSLLWDKNNDINLVIVGKKGWIIDETIELIQSSKYLNKKLFFIENASDEFLEILYKASSCLIMASKGEGFGLPLIEAAINKTPIILNDIPILREVAQNFAFYYKDDSPEELAKVIIEWLDLFKKNRHPKSEGMPFISWAETASLIFDFIVKN